MRSADAMHEHHEQVLVELTEIGMGIARGLRDEVMAAETPEAKARAAAAYPRIARAVRQCLALETRFRRDAAREALEAEGRRQKADALRLRRRIARVRLVVQQAIQDETPNDDETVETRLTDLYERLDDDVLDEDFVLAPFPEVVADIHRQLGLSPPALGDAEEDADEDPEPDDDDPEDDEAAFDAAPSPPSATPEPPPPEPYFRYSSG